MANTDWNQRIREEVEAIKSGGQNQNAAETVCQAADLKSLLNTIVEQISDADRRHTDTLVQMQERLSSMGREASTLRSKVPPQFAAAFERVEAGMADLAQRIADAGDLRTSRNEAGDAISSYYDTANTGADAPMRSPLPFAGDEPQALKPSKSPSAVPATASRKRDDEARLAGIDPFDVIETSLPGNVSDPWDRDSAEALAGIYEPSKDPYSGIPTSGDGHRSYTTQASMAISPISAIDHDWLEARFADISQRIEKSLADLQPDHAFFALNQRIDQLENHFSGLMEGVATHGDVEGVRLIEAHMSELATHLEGAHNQLMRLDGIESQLSDIVGKIDDVHRIASSAGGSGAPGEMQSAIPHFDVDAVARAVADQTASRFADMKQQNDPSRAIEDVHGLLERFINESRQGEENTTVLLDTLQQAMIRLLDRVDAMEMNQSQSQQQSAPQEYAREHVRFNVDPQRPGYQGQESTQALDAAVAAVATAKSMSTPFSHAPGSDMGQAEFDAPSPRLRASTAGQAEAARGPEKIRQDFIADARRAKLRLAAVEQAEGDVVITKPEAIAAPMPAKAEKPAGKSGKAKPAADAGKGQTSLPRLMVMGLGGLTLIGGLWYIMQGGGGAPEANVAAPAAITGAPVAGQLPADATPNGAAPAAPQNKAPSNDRSDLSPDNGDTVGQIITGEITDGTTSVPLGGIAVDAQKQFAAGDVKRAQRSQAMAAMSNKIGQAAATATSAFNAMPAALIPETADPAAQSQSGTTSVEKNTMGKRSALDMPPVTVGPLSLRLAAANGDPSAEFEVGARLAEGKGTQQNFEEAAKWYQRSADQGFVQSQYRLGTFYERGLGVKTDPAKAEDWYQRAAEQGNVKAMHNLAVLSANQNKASPDYVTAAKWFTAAADRNLSDSQFNLAVLYENGLGVPQDLKQAYKWLSLSARSGDKEAVRRRDILKGKLTADELAAAETMVKTWQGKVPDAMANDARSAGEAWKKNPANGQSG